MAELTTFTALRSAFAYYISFIKDQCIQSYHTSAPDTSIRHTHREACPGRRSSRSQPCRW